MNSSIADLAVLGKLFEEHRAKLLAMVERRMDPALKVRLCSEDILQDAFGMARSRWGEFMQRQESASTVNQYSRIYSWLYRITLDAIIEAWRKHSRSPRDVRREIPLPDSSSMQLGCGLIGQGPGPTTLLQHEEARELIRKAIARLNHSDREILWMRHGDQLSFSEISDVLEITENAATVRYARALGRLQKLWRQLCPDFGSTL